MKKILIVLLLFTTVFVNAQSVVGGAGVCVTDIDPNTVTDLGTQDTKYDCVLTFNKTNSKLWKYDVASSVWVDITQSLTSLALSGNDLEYLDENGVTNTVGLSQFLDNTDDQTVTTFSVDAGTNVLTITLEDGNTATVDLSHLDDSGTDDQALTLIGNTLTLEDGGTVDLSPYLDNTDNQTVTDLSIDASNVLSVTIEDGNTKTVDLSQLEHTGTTGSVFFAGTDGKPTEDNSNLFWDDTNDRLGLGITPDEQLHISKNMRLNGAFEDKDGEAGEEWQVLSSTVTGTDWVPSGTICGGTFAAADWDEAVNLIEATNGKKITCKDYIVTIPAGTSISSNILNVNNVGKDSKYRLILRGAGKDLTTIQNDGDSRVIDVFMSRITIEKLTIDCTNLDKQAIYIHDHAHVTLTTNSVKIINSLSSRLLEVRKFSYLSASSLIVENANNLLYAHSYCEVYLNNLIFTSRTDKDTSWVIATYVNNRVECNTSTINGEGKIYGFVSASYGGRVYCSSTIVNNFRRYGILIDRGAAVVMEKGILTSAVDADYGAYISNNSTARLRYITITGSKKGLNCRRGAMAEMDDSILSDIKDYSVLVYDNGFATCSRIKSTLRSAESIRHFHIDKGEVYSKDGEFTNGKELGRAYYSGGANVINGILTNITNGTTTNMFYLYYGGYINDSGTTINCNVPNGTVAFNGRHI